MRPLFSDFESAGVAQALQRGMEALRPFLATHGGEGEEGGEERGYWDESIVPAWMLDLDFRAAAAAADPWAVGEIAERLRSAEQRLRANCPSEWAMREHDFEEFPPLAAWSAHNDESQKRMVVALGRLVLGAAIEAALAKAASEISLPGERPSQRSGEVPSECALRVSRMYQDAFLVSIWTSSHAQYVSDVQMGTEEPPVPGLHTVANAASEVSLGGLYERRSCPKACPKQASQLLQVMMRSTNPGSRGWSSLLESALRDSHGTRRLIAGAVVIALSGMHPFLHPATRPPWQLRMRAMRVAQHMLPDGSFQEMALATSSATKEAIRRMLTSSTNVAYAMQHALAELKHPVGSMTAPPLRFPALGMEAAMATFVRAGTELALVPNADYVATVNRHFQERPDGHPRAELCKLEWDAPWLGKGTASVSQKVPLLSIASDLWFTAFRTNFISFWAHCMSLQVRAARLDPAQHEALHSMNAVTKLVLSLPLKDQLAVQRLALSTPTAGLLTMQEAAQLLGLPPVSGTSSNGGVRNSQEAVTRMSAAGAEGVAKLMAFARVAWIAEELIIVELGPITRQKQLRAIRKRFGLQENTEEKDIPMHATHIHACTECRRVSTACSVDTSRGPSSFNEIGTSSSMLCTVCAPGDPARGSSHIRCAKRSSSALKGALAFEEQSVQRLVENDPPRLGTLHAMLLSTGESTSCTGDEPGGVLRRVRQDAKIASEQRSTAIYCGERPALSFSLVGRVVRLWNEWYSLCALCGAMLRVHPHNRYGGEICCLNCDAEMLGVRAADNVHGGELNRVRCRYCGKQESDRSSSLWKMIKAPLDTSGVNRTLPPPLRVVHYCPSHTRTWLSAAHRVMQTRVILSHIAHNAKPIFSTATARSGKEAGSRKDRKRKKSDRLEAESDDE